MFICSVCNKQFEKAKSMTDHRRWHFIKYKLPSTLGRKQSLETRMKISEATRGRRAWNKGIKMWENKTPPFFGKKMSEEQKLKISQNKERALKISNSLKSYYKNLERNKLMEKMRKTSEANRGRPSWIKGKTKENNSSVMGISEKLKIYRKSEMHRKNISEAKKGKPNIKLRQLWKNPEFKERVVRNCLKGLRNKPTKPEMKIINLTEKFNLPFKYVGNGKVIIDGKNPDFIHSDGLKQIIEIFGDYWHKKKDIPYHQTEEGTNEFYSKRGFKCLILWSSELQNEEIILQKIQEFIKPV